VAQPERSYAHRSLFDKLGLRSDHRVAVRRIDNAAFLKQLTAFLENPPATSLRGAYDIIFLQVDGATELTSIAPAGKHLVANGALWIFHPKGRSAGVSDAAVRAAGLAAGLVDNKISAYTDTHTATRYVIPLARR
jgi:hypothetical protein